MPYVIAAILVFIIFCLYALTLLLFILGSKAYLALVSIAGVGGYLSGLVFSMIFDEPMTSVGVGLMGITYFALPMIAVFVYQVALSERPVDSE